MLNFNPYLNYQQRLMQMDQQPLQPMQNYTPQMQAMFVSGVDDLNKLQIMPNVVYIGINKALKEVYIKQMNYDGLTEFNTYSLASEKQEKGNIEKILEKLESLELSLKGQSNERDVKPNDGANATRKNTRASNDATFPTNDAK